MAGNTQATAPAAADASKGAGSSTAGARHAADNRPPKPDYDAMMEESLVEELGEAPESGAAKGADKGGERATKKEDSPTGHKSGSSKEKADGGKPKAGSKKLDLGDDEDEEEGNGSSAAEDEDADEQEALKKAAKAKLNEESGEEEESEEEEEEQEHEVADPEETDEEKAEREKTEAKTGSAGSKVPKGMEDWPPAAIERFQRQDAQVKELKRQLAIEGIKIEPRAASPFDNVESAEDLNGIIGQAKSWKKWCQDNPEGGSVQLSGAGRSGSTTRELTKEEVQKRLAWSEGILDVDAVSEARERLNYRETHKPWEDAERLVPDLFDRKSENYQTFGALLQQVPQLRKLNDYEYFIACGLKGLKEDQEEKSGVARYVRVEMKDGKPVLTKKPGSEKGGSSASADKKKKPTPAPNDTRSPLKSKHGNKPDLAAREKRAAETRSDEDLEDLVEAEMAG